MRDTFHTNRENGFRSFTPCNCDPKPCRFCCWRTRAELPKRRSRQPRLSGPPIFYSSGRARACCRAEKLFGKLGAVVRSAAGAAIQNPWLSVCHQLLDRMKAFMSELGLSPSARTRLKVPPQRDEPSRWEGLLA
jgi:hypothetical protein